LARLASDGVLIWDNANWPDFERAWSDYLHPAGFRMIPFRGLSPFGWRMSNTAVLYRQANILDI
jgi:hypothetical protein